MYSGERQIVFRPGGRGLAGKTILRFKTAEEEAEWDREAAEGAQGEEDDDDDEVEEEGEVEVDED